MAKIRRPTQFTAWFDIDPDEFWSTGAMDPVLNADTQLFIDPMLLSKSDQPEMANGAVAAVEDHYRKLVKLLTASLSKGDVPWRAAEKLMDYREIAATCLGYGAATVRGSGFGKARVTKLLETAAEIVKLGLTDPELFLLLPLIEEGVGPDLVSDMTTSIIAPHLVAYTSRIAKDLGVRLNQHDILGSTYELPSNPLVAGLPVLLVPRDVLDKLPTASDWSDVATAAARNRQLRAKVNAHIGELFAMTSARNKSALKAQALADRESIETLLAAVRATDPRPYDFDKDAASVLALQSALDELRKRDLRQPRLPTEPWDVVLAIIDQFQHLVEQKGLWRLFWREKRRPHHERHAQLVFLAIADSFCRANDLDLTPEADTGRGPVDFKISKGFAGRMLVEIKLSTNTKVVAGYEKQLEAYVRAEGATHAAYVVIDVGKMGRKDEHLLDARNEASRSGGSPPPIVFVSAMPQLSASKLT